MFGTNAEWPDEDMATLSLMASEGRSARQIAEAIGRSRNAVLGKAMRLGVALNGGPGAGGSANHVALVRAGLAERRAAKETVPSSPPLPRPSRPREPPKIICEPVPAEGTATISDLTEYKCRWPVGDPREDAFRYCGRAKQFGVPYCRAHAALAPQIAKSRHGTPSAPFERNRFLPRGA